MIFNDLSWGITQIDTGFYRDNMAACYLMQQCEEVAIIETGIKITVDRIFKLLEQKNISPDQVKYVIPTHVHLDHAGGVGLLMERLPGARLVIHPFGARHMVDPSKLQAGAIAVYGEEVFKNTYGNLIPVDESKIQIAEDNFELELGSRTLTFIDTPGHARHHFCVHDSLSNGVFTGDTFGLAYQELGTASNPFIFPTTTPVQFDPNAMKASIQKIMAFKPDRLFLTHFGMIDATQEIADEMIALVDAYTEICFRVKDEAGRERLIASELMNLLITRKRQQGFEFDNELALSVLKSDVELNAQGLEIWLNKLENKAAAN